MVNGFGCIAVVLGLLGGSVVAPIAAQAQSRGFVGGTIGVSLEPPGPADPTGRFLDSGLGGRALAGGLSAGVTVSPRVEIGFEASFVRGFTGEQRAPRLDARYERTHQDAIVSGVVRYRFSNRFAGVVGGSLVRSTTSEIRTDRRFVVGPGGAGYVDETFFRDYVHISPGVVLGGDLTVARWGRVVVAPSIRLYWFDQNDEDASTGLGLGSFVARPAVNAEVNF